MLSFIFIVLNFFFFFNTILICRILGDLSRVWLKESFLLRKKCIVFFLFLSYHNDVLIET